MVCDGGLYRLWLWSGTGRGKVMEGIGVDVDVNIKKLVPLFTSPTPPRPKKNYLKRFKGQKCKKTHQNLSRSDEGENHFL